MAEKVKELEDLVTQKQKELDSLSKDFILFKEKTYKEFSEVTSIFEEYDGKNKEIEKLNMEIQQLKKLNVKLENEVLNLKEKEVKLNKKLNAYMNSKLGRLTRQYWTFRKKLSIGGK